MTFITISLLIVAGILSFLAGISTKSREQKWLTASVLAVPLLLFGVATYYESSSEVDVDLTSFFSQFMAFGIVWPRLIATVVNQNRLESPTIFISRDLKPLTWILTVLFLAYVIIMMTRPSRITFPGGVPIYDEDYFQSQIGFLSFLIPGVILMIIAMLQRTAFCSNGLFYNGLLFAWSDFKFYAWQGDWLQMEKTSGQGRIQLMISNESKLAIEELLKMKIQKVPFEENRG